jgi:hypothetical protein
MRAPAAVNGMAAVSALASSRAAVARAASSRAPRPVAERGRTNEGANKNGSFCRKPESDRR